jgi:hypothetical protein
VRAEASVSGVAGVTESSSRKLRLQSPRFAGKSQIISNLISIRHA